MQSYKYWKYLYITDLEQLKVTRQSEDLIKIASFHFNGMYNRRSQK